jgi:hypothetical protein
MDIEQALAKIAEQETVIKDLTAKNEDITKNFSGFRTTAETEKKALEEKLNTTTTEYGSYKEEVGKEKTVRTEAFKSNLIKERARGDKTLIDKITAEYKNFSLPEDTEDAIKARVEKAVALHVTAPKADVNSGNGGGGASGGGNGAGGGAEDLSPQAQAIFDNLIK